MFSIITGDTDTIHGRCGLRESRWELQQDNGREINGKYLVSMRTHKF